MPIGGRPVQPARLASDTSSGGAGGSQAGSAPACGTTRSSHGHPRAAFKAPENVTPPSPADPPTPTACIPPGYGTGRRPPSSARTDRGRPPSLARLELRANQALSQFDLSEAVTADPGQARRQILLRHLFNPHLWELERAFLVSSGAGQPLGAQRRLRRGRLAADGGQRHAAGLRQAEGADAAPLVVRQPAGAAGGPPPPAPRSCCSWPPAPPGREALAEAIARLGPQS
jgi:hypothetical protein